MKVSSILVSLVFACLMAASVMAANLVANAGPDQIVKANQMVTLNGSLSSSESGIGYTWMRVSGPKFTIQDPMSIIASFTPVADGDYVIRLLVIDQNGGSASDEVTITVITPKNETANSTTEVAAVKNETTTPAVIKNETPAVTPVETKVEPEAGQTTQSNPAFIIIPVIIVIGVAAFFALKFIYARRQMPIRYSYQHRKRIHSIRKALSKR
jgi:hypothetical protein